MITHVHVILYSVKWFKLISIGHVGVIPLKNSPVAFYVK
jgi:hypothetical protein